MSRFISFFRNFASQMSEDRTMDRCHNILSGYGQSKATTPKEREHRAMICVEELERHLVDFPA